jgi:hypothetical protein
MNIVALDPYLNGAIAILKDNTIAVQPFSLSGKTLDLAELALIFRGATPALVVIEFLRDAA